MVSVEVSSLGKTSLHFVNTLAKMLYFNANIHKKLQLLGEFVPQTPYRDSAPGPRWGTSVPQTHSLLLCPPNNPVRSTLLLQATYLR